MGVDFGFEQGFVFADDDEKDRGCCHDRFEDWVDFVPSGRRFDCVVAMQPRRPRGFLGLGLARVHHTA